MQLVARVQPSGAASRLDDVCVHVIHMGAVINTFDGTEVFEVCEDLQMCYHGYSLHAHLLKHTNTQR